jgi:hypothetical protein
MAQKPKPPRKRLGFFDAQDRVISLANIYRTEAFGADRSRTMAKRTHEELDEVASPEPDSELEDSELSDNERQQAIARERLRRERGG